MKPCPNCGRPVYAVALKCRHCGAWMPEGFADAPAPPESAAAASSGPGTLVLADVGRRGVAWLIDLFVISFLAAWPVSYLFPDFATMSMEEVTNDLRIVGVMLSVIIIYPCVMEAVRGQTLGKMVAGIVVVREDGTPIGVWAAILRSVLRVVDSQFVGIIGLILILTSRRQQRLGDRVAHTIVVRRTSQRRRWL